MPSRARRLSQKIGNYLWWMSGGPASLSIAEISSIILKSDSVTENPINLSQRVLLQFDLRTLSATDMRHLMKIHGIKSGKDAL
jgi:DNA repair protein RadC